MSKGLTEEQILQLYATRRVKGLYEDRTVEFLDSDELGLDPMAQWPQDFGKKNATTVFQGFRNAVKRAELNGLIDVMQRDGKVFLCHRERCGFPVLTADTNGSEN